MGNEIVFSLVGLGCLVCALGGFLSLKREMFAFKSRIRKEREEAIAAVELLRTAQLRIEAGVAELRAASEALLARTEVPPEPGNSVNAFRRGKILLMHYRGDPVEKIVSALGVSRREVELLLKVHKASPMGLGASA